MLPSSKRICLFKPSTSNPIEVKWDLEELSSRRAPLEWRMALFEV
jgi:hypothetical protein